MDHGNTTSDPYDDYLEAIKLEPYPYYYHWMLFSFITCLLIHHVFSPLLFSRHNRAYREFPRAKRMEWDSRTVSSLHATIVSILCLMTLLTDSLIWKQPVTYPAKTGLIALSISIGYFLCDMVSMPFYWRKWDLYIFLLHHSAAALAFQQVIQYRICTFFGVYRLTTELSTPFINQRWFYRTIGYTPDRRRVCTGTLMFAILFAITRNFMIVPFWWISYRSLSTPGFVTARQAIPWLVVAFVIPPLILDYLNLYWAMKTYRIGWRAAKCLWNADWRGDIRRAHARLRKRLRRIRRRTSSESASAQTAPTSVTTAVASGLTSSSMDNLQRLPDLPDLFILESSSSSSNYSSETEYEPADSEHEFDPLKTAADKSLTNESPLNRTVPDQQDQHITQRAAPASSE